MCSHGEDSDKLFSDINDNMAKKYHYKHGIVTIVRNTSEKRKSSVAMHGFKNDGNTSVVRKSTNDMQGFKRDATATDSLNITNNSKAFEEYMVKDDDVEMLTEDEYAFKYFIEDVSKTPKLSLTRNDEECEVVKKVVQQKPFDGDDDEEIIVISEDDDNNVATMPSMTIKRQTYLKNKKKPMKEKKDIRFTLVKSSITTPRSLSSISHLIPIYGNPFRYMHFDNLIGTVVGIDEKHLVVIKFSTSSRKSDLILPVECGICHIIMNRSILPHHLKIHKDPETNRFKCPYCNKSYNRNGYLAGHIRRHLGIKPYECVYCKLYFSTKQDLTEHLKKKEFKQEQHICEFCGKTFGLRNILNRHRAAVHKKKLRFQCDHCPKGFYMRYNLNEHILKVHKGERRKFSCFFCEMKFSDPNLLGKHRKENHLHQSLYLCLICCMGFLDINFFNMHRRSIQCRNNTRLKQENNEFMDVSEQVHETKVACLIDKNGHFTNDAIKEF